MTELLSADIRISAEMAVFVDFDGTLVEIAPTPDTVHVTPELRAMLIARRTALDGALALVSGRSIADLDRQFAPERFDLAGLHGLERRHGDDVRRHPPSPLLEPARAAMAEFVRSDARLILEDKELSLALHFRLAPDRAAEVDSFLQGLVGPGLTLQAGKMVMELRVAGADKGGAIRAFLTEAPYRGRQPIFFGDDLTDEHGFAAVRDLGGIGVRVGAWEKSAAQYHLPDVAAVRAWLAGNEIRITDVS